MISVFLAGCILYPVLLSADDSTGSKNEPLSWIKLSLGTETGIFYGILKEYAYEDGIRASELDWDLKPLWYAGFSIRSVIIQKLFINFTYRSSVNEKAGNILDYDWDTSTGIKSNYSHHHCRVEDAKIINTDIGYGFSVTDWMTIIPALSYNMISIQMSAMDGYLEYPPGSEREYVIGKLIEYEQRYSIFSAGLVAVFKPFRPIEASVFFYYSPVVKCNTIDRHFRRNVDFYDSIHSGDCFWSGVDIRYAITSRCSVFIESSWFYLPSVRGDSYWIDTSIGEKSSVVKNASGINSSFIDARLGITVVLCDL